MSRLFRWIASVLLMVLAVQSPVVTAGDTDIPTGEGCEAPGEYAVSPGWYDEHIVGWLEYRLQIAAKKPNFQKDPGPGYGIVRIPWPWEHVIGFSGDLGDPVINGHDVATRNRSWGQALASATSSRKAVFAFPKHGKNCKFVFRVLEDAGAPARVE